MLIEAKDEYLTPALVAARFKVSIPTVYRWMSPEDPAAPRLESLRIGANRTIAERALAAFLDPLASSQEHEAELPD